MWMDERVQVLQEYHFLQLLVLIEFKNSKEIQHSSQHSRKKKKKKLFLRCSHRQPITASIIKQLGMVVFIKYCDYLGWGRKIPLEYQGQGWEGPCGQCTLGREKQNLSIMQFLVAFPWHCKYRILKGKVFVKVEEAVVFQPKGALYPRNEVEVGDQCWKKEYQLCLLEWMSTPIPDDLPGESSWTWI